jgi:DNA-directed RNA polymerase specialized sigma24 family protein
MKDMLQIKGHPVSINEKSLYATAEDFEQLFAKETTDLLRLSLHLTADAENAERCLIRAMRDCLFRSSVSKDRVRIWARRMVIRNAVRLIWGTQKGIVDDPTLEFQLQPSDYPLEELRESVAILTLPDLDRLAFVICVLERYSILDCALLLRKTPQKVHEAILRAADQVVPVEKGKSHDGAAASSVEPYGTFSDRGKYFASSYESILDYDCQ